MTKKVLNFVAFAGCSGSGKSTLVDSLLGLWPDNFGMWKQFTTRAKRNASDDYIFVTKNTYDVIKSTLTCKTEFNNNYYGTMVQVPYTQGDKPYAVLTIADINGMKDLIAMATKQNHALETGGTADLIFGDYYVNVIPVILNVSNERIDTLITRSGRDKEFVIRERDLLLEANFENAIIVDIGDGYADIPSLFNLLIWPRMSATFISPADKQIQKLRESLSAVLESENFMEDLTNFVNMIKPTQAVKADSNFYEDDIPFNPVNHDSEEPVTTTEALNDVPLETDTVEPIVAKSKSIHAPITGMYIDGGTFDSWILGEGVGSRAFNDQNAFTNCFSSFLSDFDIPKGHYEIEFIKNAVMTTGRVITDGGVLTIQYDHLKEQVVRDTYEPNDSSTKLGFMAE